ncbi:Zinc finger homeobox protein like [Actinidia chinensis var. chinensis]|uniref:Zinc finger homeobox protein like n=1 Tax=Actinidia chinensis var. chinensis TaxID=1590841 RepID=A0A2R6QQT8_ACTCC|nr:uncharacterized protein LOC130791103 [Actinidia eriantha]PSS13479.1 Zinc finger homeobox protein like [Actinidia chinensis var. chinensis]
MDEEMILLDNVMPVEIALKRELAYRRKVEALRKQQQSDSNNDTSHLEGPLLSLPGTKRKAPSTSSQGISSLLPSGSPQTFQKQPAGLRCTVCKVTFSTLYYVKQHCASQTHKDKLLQMKKWGTPLSNPLLCDLCNAPSSSVLTLEGHLSGIKHATSLQELESAKLGREGETKLQIFSEKHWN